MDRDSIGVGGGGGGGERGERRETTGGGGGGEMGKDASGDSEGDREAGGCRRGAVAAEERHRGLRRRLP